MSTVGDRKPNEAKGFLMRDICERLAQPYIVFGNIVL